MPCSFLHPGRHFRRSQSPLRSLAPVSLIGIHAIAGTVGPTRIAASPHVGGLLDAGSDFPLNILFGSSCHCRAFADGEPISSATRRSDLPKPLRRL